MGPQVLYSIFCDGSQGGRVRPWLSQEICHCAFSSWSCESSVQEGSRECSLYIENESYVRDRTNLLSHSQLEDEGYDVEYNGRSGNRVYKLWRGENKVLDAARYKFGLYTVLAANDVLPEVITVLHYQVAKTNLLLRKLISQPDGAADLQRWHERLGHLCPSVSN